MSFGEELANSVTHGVGLVGSLVGLPFLILGAAQGSDAWRLAGVVVFAVTLVLLYAVSTVYHALPPSRAKRIFQILDHSAIYLLIAGTYTPFTLVNLRGEWGWTLFAIVWSLAILGIVGKILFWQRIQVVSTGFYLLMGWLAVVAIGPLRAHVHPSGLEWLAVGGLLYTAGVLFYVWERLRYGHMIWHLFVLAGSMCHFWSVFRYSAG
jgi:hemolysin III